MNRERETVQFGGEDRDLNHVESQLSGRPGVTKQLLMKALCVVRDLGGDLLNVLTRFIEERKEEREVRPIDKESKIR